MLSVDEQLAAAAALGPVAYFETVLEQTWALHNRFYAQGDLTATIAERDIPKLRSLLSVSLVLNDRTAVHYLGKDEMQMHIPPPDRYRAMFGVDQIRFNVTPAHIQKYKIDPSHPTLSPCFFYSHGAELKPLLNALLPCIASGRVTLQPVRAILTKQDRSVGSDSDWHVIGADDKAPLELWEPEEPVTQGKPLRLVTSHAGPVGKTLFEVTMPFLRGVPFRELEALLTHEEDIVSAFRSSLKSAVREAAKNGTRATEIVGDVIHPRLGLLERKMKSLQRVHRIKVGGAALGSVALAFTSASTGGVGAGLLAIASAGSFGLLANQYSDYVGKLEELRQDPFYFLWKCKQVATSAKKL